MSSPRVGVIGARRSRQGLGPFVVRELRAAGAEVPCFLATSEETRRATRSELAGSCGIEARGYLDFEAMLAGEPLDALAILSPAETHERYLRVAPEAGLHALCEKPLLWGRPDLGEASARILAGFDAVQRLVVENCPWPYTLAAYEQLHPGSLAASPERFEMRLQPANRGVEMLGDSMPHALSLLQAVVAGSGGRAEQIRFSGDLERGPMIASFRYRAGEATAEVRVELAPTEAHPREASFALNGRPATRLVAPESYEISFACAGRRVPVPDPLASLVADFVGSIRKGRPASRSAGIADRMRLLEQLVTAYRQQSGAR